MAEVRRDLRGTRALDARHTRTLLRVRGGRKRERGGKCDRRQSRNGAAGHGHGWLVTAGTSYFGALRFGLREKSMTSAMLCAVASRIVSGARFQRHSIILRIEVWSKVRC